MRFPIRNIVIIYLLRTKKRTIMNKELKISFSIREFSGDASFRQLCREDWLLWYVFLRLKPILRMSLGNKCSSGKLEWWFLDWISLFRILRLLLLAISILCFPLFALLGLFYRSYSHGWLQISLFIRKFTLLLMSKFYLC